ncbi:MAG TPA: aminopeptidase P family protein [Bacteroidia bacterium]|nr:aminopeptidase P family protein [Bacteroidia bacterium]
MKHYWYFLLALFIIQPVFAQDTDLLTKEFHAERRDALRKLMPANSCAVLFAHMNKSDDISRTPYHQDPNFYYFTGLNESNAMLIIFKEPQTFAEAGEHNEVIFIKDLNPATEVWTGHLLGKNGVKEKLGFNYCLINKTLTNFNFNFASLDKIFLLQALTDCPSSYVEEDIDLEAILSTKISTYINSKLNTDKLPYWVAALREIKQPEEIVLMRKAISNGVDAHKELMKALVPGMFEYQAQAVIECMFKRGGMECEAYPSILGGGENSCILHYETNRKQLAGNDMLVIDAGGEYHGYAADITRTLPVDGKFSAEEKAIYDIVLEAQEEGIKACKTGNQFNAPHRAAVSVIQKRLKELGITKNETEYQKYFFHGTSHYLGLDVHDVGNGGKLNPGTIITVEPGIYIPSGSPCDPKWWNIGVRIEDDVLITAGEPDVLSGKLPKKTEEIEAIMAEESEFNKLK